MGRGEDEVDDSRHQQGQGREAPHETLPRCWWGGRGFQLGPDGVGTGRRGLMEAMLAEYTWGGARGGPDENISVAAPWGGPSRSSGTIPG